MTRKEQMFLNRLSVQERNGTIFFMKTRCIDVLTAYDMLTGKIPTRPEVVDNTPPPADPTLEPPGNPLIKAKKSYYKRKLPFVSQVCRCRYCGHEFRTTSKHADTAFCQECVYNGFNFLNLEFGSTNGWDKVYKPSKRGRSLRVGVVVASSAGVPPLHGLFTEDRIMRVEIIKTICSWRDVADAARTTVGMEAGTGEPSMKWKRNILLSEHSPVRKLQINWKWYDLPYWVSVHLVRHKYGIEHWVRTQREDRTGIPRADKQQGAPVEHECLANAAEIMFISRRRLCNSAAPETRAAWKAFVDELWKIDPALASCCVRECVYRGFCPEAKCCGYVNTGAYRLELGDYRANG